MTGFPDNFLQLINPLVLMMLSSSKSNNQRRSLSKLLHLLAAIFVENGLIKGTYQFCWKDCRNVKELEADFFA